MNPGERPASPTDGITETASAPAGAAPPAPPAPAKKSLWDTILTSTPILLTVVATLFAGMSSSQMTQAMYHRSVAAQEESKGGNQWAFFQAKRIRGTSLEMTLVELKARPGFARVKLADLPARLDKQAKEFAAIESDAGEIVKALREGGAGDKEPLRSALAAAEELRKSAYDRARATEKAAADLRAALKQPLDPAQKAALATDLGKDRPPLRLDTRADLVRFVDGDGLPRIKEEDGLRNAREKPETDPQAALTPALNDLNPLLQVSLDAVRERKTDPELDDLFADKAGRKAHPVTRDQVRQAIEVAERRARAFDDVNDLVLKGGAAGFQAAADEQEARAADLAVSADELRSALARLPADAMPVAGVPLPEGKSLRDARTGAERLAGNADRLRGQAHTLAVGVRADLLDYDARRYRQEAKYNQAVAGLRDLQARLSGFTSDDHRRRSQWFFYGMLAAQGGVTVATFALAVRLKGLLWGIATAAGLIAVSIGAFVFLGV